MAVPRDPLQTAPSPPPNVTGYPAGGTVTAPLPTASLPLSGLGGSSPGSTPLTPTQALLDYYSNNIASYFTGLQQEQGIQSGIGRESVQHPYDITGFGLAAQMLGLQQQGTTQDYQTALAQNALQAQIQGQSYAQQLQGEQSSEVARGSSISSGADLAKHNLAVQNQQVLDQLGISRKQIEDRQKTQMAEYGVQQAQNTLQQGLTQALFGYDQADAASQLQLLAGAMGVNEQMLLQQLLSSGALPAGSLPPGLTLPGGSFTGVGGAGGLRGKSAPIPGQLSSYQPLIQQASQQSGVPAQVFDAIFTHESGGNPTAVGDQGTSFGLAQIHMLPGRDVTPSQAEDPSFAINWTAQELGAAYKQFNGNIPATILYHNDPSGAVYYFRTGQFRTASDRNYVQAVMDEMGG